uniref:acyl-CoA dehydrogenase C-terminal domain-containing protein n=1 Tax=Nocardia aobensis TaxID=257277 RepID=UPI00278BF58B|nr:acyl-CoA dehydrogenase C-terminal domain-containing protein [Nocardia aobensis]
MGLNAVRFLLAVGDLLVAWRLIAAETALIAIKAGQNTTFYAGKIAVASFFANAVLPHVTAELAVVSGTDTTVMDLDEPPSDPRRFVRSPEPGAHESAD